MYDGEWKNDMKHG
jgi:hypothetical protein